MGRKSSITPLAICWDGKLRTAIDGKYGEAYGLAIKSDGTLIAIPEEEWNQKALNDSVKIEIESNVLTNNERN